MRTLVAHRGCIKECCDRWVGSDDVVVVVDPTTPCTCGPGWSGRGPRNDLGDRLAVTGDDDLGAVLGLSDELREPAFRFVSVDNMSSHPA